jgi:site-specific recombinase XerD
MSESQLVRSYAEKLGVAIGAHALCATAATNALEHEADIALVQEWLGRERRDHLAAESDRIGSD